MIREIKKNRELLKFSEFIYGLECLYTMQYTSFFNKGDLVFIYSIEHITNKLTVHKYNIKRAFGVLVSDENIIKCIKDNHIINEVVIL